MKNKNFPNKIAVFPLPNAVFFPNTILPLNIFEDRYIQLVNDCMKESRMFGMIQPKNRKGTSPDVYSVGCLGKIISFNETNDKRFIINLSGIIRFRVKSEIKKEKLYRNFEVDYSDFLNDLSDIKEDAINYNKNKFLKKIKIYFEKINYPIDFNELKELTLDQLVSTICMIAPFSVEEKQKLIETENINNKMKILEEIINFSLLGSIENKTIQ